MELTTEQQRMAELEAQVAALEKDKARLEALFPYVAYGGAFFSWDNGIFTFEGTSAYTTESVAGIGKTERQAIDAAIAKLHPEHIPQSGETLKDREK